MASVAGIFILVFTAVMAIPCIGIALLGYHMITKLGQFPSKTPAIQMGIFLWLMVIEVISLALLLGFFKALSSE